MKLDRLFLTVMLILLFTWTVPAQEPQLIDETVARVNSDIITRSTLLKAQEAYKAELAQRYPNEPAKQKEEFDKLAGTLLEVLIEDKLIGQRAIELGIDVEPEINRYILAIAKQTNPNWSLQEFIEALKQQNIDIEDVRKNFRTEAQRRVILYREVINPIYEKLKADEKREFYEKNKDKFAVPGSYSFSEIFVTTEGRSDAEAEAIAKQVVSEARAGKAFADLVKSYSDPKRPSSQKNGEYITINEPDMADYLKQAVLNLKTGDVSSPIRVDKGFQIVRVNEHKPATYKEFSEVEDICAQEISLERGNGKLKEYFQQLKEKSYIRIADAYKVQNDALNAKP